METELNMTLNTHKCMVHTSVYVCDQELLTVVPQID